MEGGAAAEHSWRADDQLFAFNLMRDAQRLSALDDLWSSLLESPKIASDPSSNLPLLQALVGEMVGSLANVTAATEQLERLADLVTHGLGVNLDVELASVLRRADDPRLVEVSTPSPFMAAIHDACSVLREEAPREISEIAAKLLRISEGQFELGDWGVKVKKALLIVAAAAGLLVAVSVPGAIAIPVALAAGAGVVSVVAGTLVAWDSLPAD